MIYQSLATTSRRCEAQTGEESRLWLSRQLTGWVWMLVGVKINGSAWGESGPDQGSDEAPHT